MTSPQDPALSPTHADEGGELVPAGGALQQHPIASVLKNFQRGVEDYRDAIRLAYPAIAEKRTAALEASINRIDAYTTEKSENGLRTLVANDAHAARDMLDAVRETDRLMESRIFDVTARSFFIGVFSEFDSFIGNLLKAIYIRKPDLFRNIKREIALNELLDFQDLEAVKLDMLEKEIDSFRRDSYVEQFAELERRFHLNTLRSFPEWSEFVEVSQRRNVMTHNGGLVSEQYLLVCEREKFQFNPRPEIGGQLGLPLKYLMRSIFLVSKVGFMLAHTLWRKVLPNDAAEANASLNEALYGFLLSKRWRSAAELGIFGLSRPMCAGLDDIHRRVRVINTAIGLKQWNRVDEAYRVLDAEDWTACLREFKLAVAVLKEEWASAAGFMRDIGKKGELLVELSYHDWPLFTDFRDRPEFCDAYEAIYKVPFLKKATEKAQERTDAARQRVEAEASATPSDATLAQRELSSIEQIESPGQTGP